MMCTAENREPIKAIEITDTTASKYVIKEKRSRIFIWEDYFIETVCPCGCPKEQAHGPEHKWDLQNTD